MVMTKLLVLEKKNELCRLGREFQEAIDEVFREIGQESGEMTIGGIIERMGEVIGRRAREMLETLR